MVDLLNAWGLLLVGAGLMVGFLTRLAACGGVALLALYYMAHPALFTSPAEPVEGHYLIVNKNLVELFALVVVAVMPAARLGLDGVLGSLLARRRLAAQPAESESAAAALPFARRQILAGLVSCRFWATLPGRAQNAATGRPRSRNWPRGSCGISALDEKPDLRTLDDLKGKLPTTRSTRSVGPGQLAAI